MRPSWLPRHRNTPARPMNPALLLSALVGSRTTREASQQQKEDGPYDRRIRARAAIGSSGDPGAAGAADWCAAAYLAPFGQLAAAVLAGDGPAAIRLARETGALPLDAEVDPRLITELLHPIVATAAGDSFTYSRGWLRGLMAHFTEPRFAPALRNLTPPPEYALVWRATLSAAGLFAQLGATVPTRGFHLAYSPGFRGGVPPARPQRPGGTLRRAS